MALVKKVGVAWKRTFKNNKEGIKISLFKTDTYVAYVNTAKKKDTDPDYVVCQFIDEPKKK